MLVLTRKVQESIVIDNKIIVRIIDIKGEQVRLGIEAPKSVQIFRKEIYEAIQKENIQASKGKITDNTLENIFKKNTDNNKE